MIEVKEQNDTYYFIVKAESGHILLNSVPFSNKEELKQSIRDLNASKNVLNVFERKTNHEGKFLFNLKNTEGKLVGSSALYYSEAGMENGIKNFKARITLLASHGAL
ncbi:MAG: YegP family protein [Flavobacteriaceae bacterium]